MRLVLTILIGAILAVATYSTFQLVQNHQASSSGLCPVVLGIPACYLVLAAFMTALIMLIMNRPQITFWAVCLVAGIALIGSVGNVMGLTECPKASNGTPMCYTSLQLNVALILMLSWRKRMR